MPMRPEWGSVDSFGSAAYWIYQARKIPVALQSQQSLRDETVACLLGGYGMPAEVGAAAFRAVSASGLLARAARPTHAAIGKVLSQPLTLGRRTVRYRFPKQKARYLAAALAY